MVAKLVLDQLEKTGGLLTPLTLPSVNATTGQYMQNDGSGGLSWVAAPADVSGFSKVTYVTATDATWAFEATTNKAIVEVQASGGAAGNNDAAGWQGGGGGGGSYASKFLDSTAIAGVTPKLNILIGGVAGIAASGNTTSITQAGTAVFTTITCVGGGGGASGAGVTGTGGEGGAVPTTGDINMPGGNGGGKDAGGSFMGIDTRNRTSAAGAGPAACGYGRGGRGGTGAGSPAGGTGGPAIVIVWEFV